jgi:RimJ/RimL family protein N-acetyltransferase
MSNLNPKDLYLEKISSKHINEGWLEWVNNSSNQRDTLNRPPHKYNRKQLYKYLKDLKKKKDLMFAVRLKKNNIYIGNLRISDIDNYNKSCGYGRLLGNTKYRGKGYGLLFLYKICEVAFEKLKMNKIFTHCYADNYRSLANNIKFGMRISGYFRGHFRKNNRFKDVYYLELTKEEFKKIKQKFK